MMHYEVERALWPYKGIDKRRLENGFNCFFHWYPKKVAMALWRYDVWDNLCDEDKLTYVQTWAESTDNMHSYPFASLDALADYLIKEKGYTYSDLITMGYDAVDKINLSDDIWVWDYDGTLRSYDRWIDFKIDFIDFGEWVSFIRWATNAYENNAVKALKKTLKNPKNCVHLDYIEMLGDYFGPSLGKLTDEKRGWFIRRIKFAHQVGNEDAIQILLG